MVKKCEKKKWRNLVTEQEKVKTGQFLFSSRQKRGGGIQLTNRINLVEEGDKKREVSPHSFEE